MGIVYYGYRDQEAHHIDNISLIYAHPDGHWTLSGYVKNVMNYTEKCFRNAIGDVGGIPDLNIGPRPGPLGLSLRSGIKSCKALG
jgi:hypothetical protein